MAPKLINSVVDDIPIGRCEECGKDAVYLDRVLLCHFSLSVCINCRQDQTLHHGAFELLSKSRARAEYALPDSSFCGLPHLNKPNPRHEAFAPLQLYLRRTLVQEAYRLYGNEEGLLQEKEKRKKRAYRSAARRTKHLLKKQHIMHLNRDVTEMVTFKKEMKNTIEFKPASESDHRHEYGKECLIDEKANIWFKTCGCGMRVEFEKW
ncbi:dna repair protein [Plasmopara halstedii]|uniref:Dna repair protein n=1 Tax=Plasmopara halstedii TaxID=4781 RepID=A0A0N7L8M1_PLAHL|nr:dna repair protein [Plasmopara halstedii]CEG50259.1 dna repair protein [Plasmopara halstedii]|eukprot:XP_024586628.1 dna repair protein [Plasmopara halstedii]